MLRWTWAIIAGVWLGGAGLAADVDPEHAKFFEREIRPLLAERCFKCHGERKQSGGLRLDIRANAFAGGESGAAVVPGNLPESLLIGAVKHESFEMPPDGKLAEREINALVKWVELGAPWPGDDRPTAKIHIPGQITDEDRQWWAIQPVTRPTPPALDKSDGVRNDIDRFIGRKLADAGLVPAPEADRRTLIRRLTLDLIGLPPTPAEVEAFVSDVSPDAYQRVVEDLLQRPQYGERWARHWLDLVRYADSDGYRADDFRPHAWRYRDYVIRSFNSDKPYDRFLQEQLAGDELFPGDPEALTGTGYLRQWIYEYNNRDARGQWEIILNDITDTTADVFLGLGLQCARCHDHKFDPLLQADYFRLQGFFAALRPRDDLVAATQADQRAHAERMQTWEDQTAELRRKLAGLEAQPRAAARKSAIDKFPDDVQAMIHKPDAERTPYEQQIYELAYRQVTHEYNRIDTKLKGEVKDQYLALRKELSAFDKLKPAPLPDVMAVTDLGPVAAEVLIPKKGKSPIEPGYPTIIDPNPAMITPIAENPHTTGRRAALAKWLTSRDNPLTARVIVNRLWQQHFGRGLAVNASDFGRLGEAPSHPELLDWLAGELMDHGWSLKHIHRLIVTSATYRLSSEHPDAALARSKDPENRLLWRGSVRRLDSEQIRDSLYAAAGELKLDAAGGPGAASEGPVRSIYLRFLRNQRNPLLDVFDVPFGISSAASRHVTTTPIQSLLLINSQMMLKQATALEKRLSREAGPTSAERIDHAYRVLFGRPAESIEIAAASEFIDAQRRRIDVVQADSAAARFEYGKIPFRDGQAAVMTPAHPPMRSPQPPEIANHDFTVEAYVVLRSVYDSGAVRVIASAWSGNELQPGWSFGVTGKASRRKPQTLVLQLVGMTAAKELLHEPLFSDHTIQLNKPYYLAAAVRFARDGQPGSVEFHAKDLSNDDEPLASITVPHRIAGGIDSEFPLTIGGRMSPTDARFDGLIDDVRLSNSPLSIGELLFNADAAARHTVGFWRFEPEPDVFADASGKGRHLSPVTKSAAERALSAEQQAWIDLCHVLLNSNEFLYVR
ncbi:MAG: DUF1549 domain-containing protein [Planctomycetaceae bacterium]|nr:DUF1549 domain-containing protein [Planctomycetaceae bacterium]